MAKKKPVAELLTPPPKELERSGYAQLDPWVMRGTLENIEEEVDGIDFAVANFREAKAALLACRKLARQALGKEEADA